MIPKKDPYENLIFTARRSGLWVPQPLRMSPGYPCCCGGECPCSRCSGANHPCCLSVVIDGLVNDGSDYCICMNGTYLVTYYDNCEWRSTGGPGEWLALPVVTLLQRSGDYILQCAVAGIIFEKNYSTTKPTCTNFSSESLSYVSTDGNCDGTSATCLISTSADESCTNDDFGCCTEPNCEDGRIAASATVTLPALSSNNSCADCADLAGPFVLDFYGFTLAGSGTSTCTFKYIFPSAICDCDQYVFASIRSGTDGFGPWRLWSTGIYCTAGGKWWNYLLTQRDPPWGAGIDNCLTFDVSGIPLDSECTDCECVYTSGTASIIAN